jgi:hypothetical protein
MGFSINYVQTGELSICGIQDGQIDKIVGLNIHHSFATVIDNIDETFLCPDASKVFRIHDEVGVFPGLI